MIRQLRARLAGGETLLGTFIVEMRTPATARVLKTGGFDFLVIDAEHGLYDPGEVGSLIAAARSAGICPLARTPLTDLGGLARILDAGAEGIIVPMIRSMDDVRLAVAAVRYPPVGRRGVHVVRPHCDFVAPPDGAEYCRQANRNLMLIVQIETLEAVELIEEIAAADQVDALFVGPIDLSATMGHHGGISHPDVIEVAGRLARACRAHGKVAACYVNGPDELDPVLDVGFSFITCGVALGILSNGAAALVDGAKRKITARTGRERG